MLLIKKDAAKVLEIYPKAGDLKASYVKVYLATG